MATKNAVKIVKSIHRFSGGCSIQSMDLRDGCGTDWE